MLEVKKQVLFDTVRPGWLDSDLIRLKTGGVVVDQNYVESVNGRKLLKAGYPVGEAPDGSGKYVPARRSALTVEGYTDNTRWAFRAIAAKTGKDGNSITIELEDPGQASQELAVTVTGTAITVSLATDADMNVISTTEDVVEALGADDDVMGLLGAVVTVAGADVVVGATDGPQNLVGGVDAKFLTLADVEVTGGDNSVAVLDQGRVIVGGLPVGLDGLPVVDAGVRAQLPEITFVA